MTAIKKPDALKIFEKLWDLTKKKGDCDFQDNLFRLRIHLAKGQRRPSGICKERG